MDPAEAVDAFTLCGAKTALGHHWGTFQLTAEDAQAPRRALAAALDRKGITPDRFLPVQPGQVHVLGN
jgi:L-ascorbate metabolism protein UlaG (beta-lactamase superfamily)